jgi:hypothetical protein
MAFGRLGGSFARVGQWAGSGGVCVWPPHNQVVASKDATNNVGLVGITITANTTAGPFADVTADQLACAGGNNSYLYKSAGVLAVAGTTYNGSVYLKVTTTPVQIGIRCNSGDGSGTDGKKVVSVTTVWQRFDVSCIAGTTSAINVAIDTRSFVTGDDGLAKTVIAADWQINRGTIPTAYVAT